MHKVIYLSVWLRYKKKYQYFDTGLHIMFMKDVQYLLFTNIHNNIAYGLLDIIHILINKNILFIRCFYTFWFP